MNNFNCADFVHQYSILQAIYNLYFHPLARYKGPPFMCAYRVGFVISLLRGNFVADVKTFHEKYGDIVRIAPNELSFAKEEAWHDIFGTKPFPKNLTFFKTPEGQTESMIITTNDADNARMRKLLAPAFTEKAMVKQESHIQSYIDLLMKKLEVMVDDSEKNGRDPVVDVVKWFNFFTFDLIGDLAFGESFGCLENTTYHPWVSTIFFFLKGRLAWPPFPPRAPTDMIY